MSSPFPDIKCMASEKLAYKWKQTHRSQKGSKQHSREADPKEAEDP